VGVVAPEPPNALGLLLNDANPLPGAGVPTGVVDPNATGVLENLPNPPPNAEVLPNAEVCPNAGVVEAGVVDGWPNVIAGFAGVAATPKAETPNAGVPAGVVVPNDGAPNAGVTGGWEKAPLGLGVAAAPNAPELVPNPAKAVGLFAVAEGGGVVGLGEISDTADASIPGYFPSRALRTW
jgi:hypothetical protein